MDITSITPSEPINYQKNHGSFPNQTTRTTFNSLFENQKKITLIFPGISQFEIVSYSHYNRFRFFFFLSLVTATFPISLNSIDRSSSFHQYFRSISDLKSVMPPKTRGRGQGKRKEIEAPAPAKTKKVKAPAEKVKEKVPAKKAKVQAPAKKAKVQAPAKKAKVQASVKTTAMAQMTATAMATNAAPTTAARTTTTPTTESPMLDDSTFYDALKHIPCEETQENMQTDEVKMKMKKKKEVKKKNQGVVAKPWAPIPIQRRRRQTKNSRVLIPWKRRRDKMMA